MWFWKDRVLSTTYTSSKNNDKLDIYLRREHPPYDVSTPKQERELTIENTDTIRGLITRVVREDVGCTKGRVGKHDVETKHRLRNFIPTGASITPAG